MPPSGYNNTQAESVCDFLRSCTGALIEENRGLREPKSAIKREIESISRDLIGERRPSFEQELLALTKSFYEDLLNNCPDDLSHLKEHAEDILANLNSRILAIHVNV